MVNEVKLKLAIEGGRVVGAELDGVSSALDRVDNSAKNTTSGASTLRNMLATVATVGTAAALIHMADACTTLNTSLRLSSNSAAEAHVAYERIFGIAQKARVSFTELGATYTSIARAGNELGVSQNRLLVVTEAIANAMTIGGGSAQSMQAALVQLSQGLSSGTLRGEELNSILEQTPRLAKALADGLGVSVGQLRSLGEQGKLTAEAVIGALEKSAPQLAKEMASSTLTVGQAFTVLTNSVTKFVGDADGASGASNLLAKALQGIAGAVDSVGATINSNKTAFAAIAAGLAGAAVVAGVAALASKIAMVTAAVKLLGVVMLANPVVLTLAAIAAGGMALAAAANSASKSTTGLGYSIADLNTKIANGEAAVAGLNAKGYAGLAKTEADRVNLMKTERSRLYGELAVLQDQDNASYNAKETKNLQERMAAEQAAYAGAKPLDEVRKMGKLRNDILVESNEQAVNIAKAFNKAIANASSPEVAVALEKERSARLIANARETTAALKSYDDQKAAPAKEAAKQRLDVLIAGYEQNQVVIAAGEQRNLAALDHAHAMGLESDRTYIAAKQNIAATANAAQQAVVEQELAAVQRSGLALKDRQAQEEKFVLELKKLRELAVGIVEKADQEIAAADNKVFRAAVEQNATAIEAQQAKATSLEDQVKAQRQANAEIGLSAVEVNKLRSATMELSAAEKVRLADLIELSSPELAKAYRDQAKAMRELIAENTKGVEKSAAAENFKSIWQSIDQTAHSVFTNIFQGGQDTFSKLRDVLKSTLLDLLYQMTVKKWIFNIVASVTGGGAAGVVSAAANAAGVGNTASGVGVLANLFGSGGVIAEGISGMGAAMMNGPFSAMLGDFGASIVANSSVIAGAIPWIGAAMAGISLLSDAMQYTVTPTGNALTADFKSSGVSSVGTLSTFHQSGGFMGGGETDNGLWGVADSGTTGYINQQVVAVTAASKAYASAIGLDATALDGFTQSVVINTTGMDEAATKAAIDAEVVRFANAQISQAYGDTLATVSRSGETTTQTLTRIVTDLGTVNSTFSALGYTLYDVSVAGGAAASNLVQVMGGLQSFQAQMSTFYQGYYTADEQKANTIGGVVNDLGAAGINFTAEQIGAANRADIRAVVDAYAANKDTTEGAAKYAAVVKAANTLLTVTPAADAAAKPQVQAPQPVASGGGGGGGSSPSAADSANSVKSALQQYTDAIRNEVKRIRDLMEGDSEQAQARAQMRLDLAAVQADAGSEEALKSLPELAQNLNLLAESNSSTLLELRMVQAQTAATLERSAAIASKRYGLSVPAFSEGGGHGGGWAMVGERGPELAYLPPARIYTASDTRSMLNSSGGGSGGAELAVAMQAIATAIDESKAIAQKAADAAETLATLFTFAMPDRDAVQTRSVT